MDHRSNILKNMELVHLFGKSISLTEYTEQPICILNSQLNYTNINNIDYNSNKKILVI